MIILGLASAWAEGYTPMIIGTKNCWQLATNGFLELLADKKHAKKWLVEGFLAFCAHYALGQNLCRPNNQPGNQPINQPVLHLRCWPTVARLLTTTDHSPSTAKCNPASKLLLRAILIPFDCIPYWFWVINPLSSWFGTTTQLQ